MERGEGRKLSQEAQHERRRQVIRAWKRGAIKVKIAEDLGLSYSGVNKIVRSDKAKGQLTPLQRGRRQGLDCGYRRRKSAIFAN